MTVCMGGLRTKVFVVCALLCLTRCALPAAERGQQQFVPESELSSVSLARLGMEAYRSNQPVVAELRLRQALLLEPDAAVLAANLARVLEENDQSAEALAIYDRLLAKSPGSLLLLAGRARVFVRAGRVTDARAIYKGILEQSYVKGDFALAVGFARNLALLASSVGDEEGALCYSGEALWVARSLPELARHARLLNSLNRPADAISIIQNLDAELVTARDAANTFEWGVALAALANSAGAKSKFGHILDLESAPDGLMERSRIMLAALGEEMDLPLGTEALDRRQVPATILPLLEALDQKLLEDKDE